MEHGEGEREITAKNLLCLSLTQIFLLELPTGDVQLADLRLMRSDFFRIDRRPRQPVHAKYGARVSTTCFA